VPTNTKPRAEILELNKVNGCNDISFGDHSILEGDRIPPLKSHGQALEEELCFPGVLSDNSDALANLLRHFYGCLMRSTCCLDGKRTEDVGAGQIIIIIIIARANANARQYSHRIFRRISCQCSLAGGRRLDAAHTRWRSLVRRSRRP